MEENILDLVNRPFNLYGSEVENKLLRLLAEKVKKPQYGVDAREFGALGDYSNDDTAFLQAAIDNVNVVSRFGGKVMLPSGNFRITKSLVLPSNVTIEGFNNMVAIDWTLPKNDFTKGTTVIYVDGDFDAIVAKDCFHFSVKGITFIHSSKNAATALSLNNGKTFSVESCIFKGFESGIDFTDSGIGTVRNCIFIDCKWGINGEPFDLLAMQNYFTACNRGIFIGTSGGGNIIAGNKIEWCYEYGIHLYQTGSVADSLIVNNVIDRNYCCGAYLNQVKRATLRNNTFIRNGAVTTTNVTYMDSHVVVSALEDANINIENNSFLAGYVNDDRTGDVKPSYVLRMISPIRENSINFKGNTFANGFSLVPFKNDPDTRDVLTIDSQLPSFKSSLVLAMNGTTPIVDATRVVSDIMTSIIKSSRQHATSKPTTGNFNVGDKKQNTSPSELGTAGSKYIIDGWTCIASPSTWVERRCLTGN